MSWRWPVESLLHYSVYVMCLESLVDTWWCFCRIVKFCRTKQHITSTIPWRTMKRWKAMNQIGFSLEFTDSGCRAAAQYVYRKTFLIRLCDGSSILFLFIEEVVSVWQSRLLRVICRNWDVARNFFWCFLFFLLQLQMKNPIFYILVNNSVHVFWCMFVDE